MSDSHAQHHTMILWTAFALVLLGSLIVSTYRYAYVKDYLIQVKADCTADEGACFIEICEADDPRCEDEQRLYKFIVTTASLVPACDAEVGCPPLACELNDLQCQVIYCSPDTLESFAPGDTCAG